MSDYGVEALKQKNSRELSDEEILQVLEADIEANGVPKGRDLEGNEEWNIKRYVLESRFGCQNNALWRLGIEPNEEKLVRTRKNSNIKTEDMTEDERTELAQHELRTFEHEYSRPPAGKELQSIYSGDLENFRARSGLPYEPLTTQGVHLSQEREDELVNELLVEERDPLELFINEEASEKEIDLITGAYIPWVDEYKSVEEKPEAEDYSQPSLAMND